MVTSAVIAGKKTMLLPTIIILITLSRTPIENLVPVQVLDKLSESHCLFLGYPVHDLNLRVFLTRIWRGESFGTRSWAIAPSSLAASVRSSSGRSLTRIFTQPIWRNMSVNCKSGLTGPS